MCARMSRSIPRCTMFADCDEPATSAGAPRVDAPLPSGRGALSDQPFRIALAIGAVLLLPVMIYHRVRAQSTHEPLDRRQEGLFFLLTLRPVGLATILGFFAFLIRPEWMAWSSVPLPAW